MQSEANFKVILERATEVLGNEDSAREWVDKKSTTLGATPRELAGSEEGTRQVLLHLAGISRHRLG